MLASMKCYHEPCSQPQQDPVYAMIDANISQDKSQSGSKPENSPLASAKAIIEKHQCEQKQNHHTAPHEHSNTISSYSHHHWQEEQ